MTCYHYRLGGGRTVYDLASEQKYDNQDFNKVCNMASESAVIELLEQGKKITVSEIAEKTVENLLRDFNFKKFETKIVAEKPYLYREFNNLDDFL